MTNDHSEDRVELNKAIIDHEQKVGRSLFNVALNAEQAPSFDRADKLYARRPPLP